MQISRQRRPPVGIDMSPLIDCVFQLLIFFMLSSSMLTPMIQLSLPKAASGAPADPTQIIVTVDETGAVFLNTQRVPIDRLQAELAPLLARSPQKVVTFRGDEKAQFQHFVRVLDAARSAGAANVHIAHQPAAK